MGSSVWAFGSDQIHQSFIGDHPAGRIAVVSIQIAFWRSRGGVLYYGDHAGLDALSFDVE